VKISDIFFKFFKFFKNSLPLSLTVVFLLITALPAFAVKTVKADVHRIVDGDTIIAAIEGKNERVRFIGVDTPESVKPGETAQPFGSEASAFTKEALSGKIVWLEIDAAPRDKYQRLLAYVWLSPPSGGEPTEAEIRGNLFNSVLLLGGYARLITIPPNVKYSDRFTRFQTEAREHVRGLWKRNS
jgi:micrococcal nuclease